MSVDADFLFEARIRWNYFPGQKSKGGELPEKRVATDESV